MSKHIITYLARHGTTDLNQKDAFRGPIDAPLDREGWRDAHQLAYYFNPLELSHIFHSGKIRTRETAKLIGDQKDIKPTENKDLAAWNVGDLGGQPKNKKNLDLVEWHVQHPSVPLPGGESLDEFRERVRPIIAGAIDLSMDCGCPLLLVCHSSVIHEAGSMIRGDHEYALVEPGGVAAIYIAEGKLGMEPIFKPKTPGHKVDIVT